MMKAVVAKGSLKKAQVAHRHLWLERLFYVQHPVTHSKRH